MNSQKTDSNVAINFCENKTDGQEEVKASMIRTLSDKNTNRRSNVFLK